MHRVGSLDKSLVTPAFSLAATMRSFRYTRGVAAFSSKSHDRQAYRSCFRGASAF